MSNEDLNKLHCWKDEACVFCGRKYPETVLNIEGTIHYRAQLQCVDKKKCEKQQRKNKKR